MFISIWPCSRLCSTISGLVLVCVWSSAGLCSAVLMDGWSSASLCSAILMDGWSSAGLCSAVLYLPYVY